MEEQPQHAGETFLELRTSKGLNGDGLSVYTGKTKIYNREGEEIEANVIVPLPNQHVIIYETGKHHAASIALEEVPPEGCERCGQNLFAYAVMVANGEGRIYDEIREMIANACSLIAAAHEQGIIENSRVVDESLDSLGLKMLSHVVHGKAAEDATQGKPFEPDQPSLN